MNAVKIWYLQQFNLLQELPKTELEYLARSMPLVRYREGEEILLAEEGTAKVYFIKKGIVKIGTYDESGQEDLKYLVQEGNIFGELALVDQEDPNEFAVAVEESLICPMDLATIRYLMERYPGLNKAVIQLMGERIKKLERRLSSILFKPSKERVREFIADYLQTFGKEQEDGSLKLRNQLTHSDMARFTATSRQTVNAVLNQLRKRGLIDYNKDWMWTTPEDLKMIPPPALSWEVS